MRRNKTDRETYSWLIGYDLGTLNIWGHDEQYVYNGAYWDPDTNKKQYEFIVTDKRDGSRASYLTDYKGFKEIISKVDLPKRPRKTN